MHAFTAHPVRADLAARIRQDALVEQPPDGYVEPFIVYLVEYTDSREQPGWAGQLGGFNSLEEAERLRARLTAEGGWGEVLINFVAIHSRLEDYEYDR